MAFNNTPSAKTLGSSSPKPPEAECYMKGTAKGITSTILPYIPVSAYLKVGQVTLKLVGQQSFVQLSNRPTPP